MAKVFKIVLHPAAEASTSFLSGSEVSGEVIVEIDEAKKYESIKILLKGEGEARVSNGRDSHTTEREKYVDFAKVLWDKNQSPGPDHVLPAGEHRFPFQFTLPSLIPSSFEVRDHGWIRYCLKAVISEPSSRLHTVEAPLQVTEAVDVNTAELDRPLQFEEQKVVGCLCCVSGLITTTVEIPRTGYCAGEKVKFQVTVENGSNRRVECVARWDRRNLFTAHTAWGRNTMKASIDVSHGVLLNRPIEPHSTQTWESSFTIPVGTPVLVNTKIIKSYFQVNVVVVIPYALNLSNSIPLTIGNKPYHQA